MRNEVEVEKAWGMSKPQSCKYLPSALSVRFQPLWGINDNKRKIRYNGKERKYDLYRI